MHVRNMQFDLLAGYKIMPKRMWVNRLINELVNEMFNKWTN